MNQSKAPGVNKQANKWTIFGLVSIGIFMSTLDGSIVNVALPEIMADFETSLGVIEWIMLTYLLTVSSLLLSFGRLSDIKGRRWVFVRGLVIFSTGSLFCGISTGPFTLIASRAFQGIGAAMIMACTPALITDVFPVSERGKALGMNGTIVAAGLTLGPVLGGLITEYLSWHYIFLINIPIGFGAAVLSSVLLKGTHADVIRSESFDLLGAILLITSLGSLVFVAARGHDLGFGSVPVIVMALVSLASFAGLARTELRRTHPIVDPNLLNIRLFSLPLAAGMILFAGLFFVVFLMPFYLTHPQGCSMEKTGHIMMTPFLCLFVVSPISGTLSDRIGSRFLCTAGMGGLAAGLYLLGTLSDGAPLSAVVWRLALVGAGTALFLPPNSAVVMTSVPEKHKGIAAATLAAARNLGMVFGIAVAGTVFNSTFKTMSGGLELQAYAPETAPVFMDAFGNAMLTGALIAGAGSIVSFMRGKDLKRYENEEIAD